MGGVGSSGGWVGGGGQVALPGALMPTNSYRMCALCSTSSQERCQQCLAHAQNHDTCICHVDIYSHTDILHIQSAVTSPYLLVADNLRTRQQQLSTALSNVAGVVAEVISVPVEGPLATTLLGDIQQHVVRWGFTVCTGLHVCACCSDLHSTKTEVGR